jgi:hypothetical protein
MYYIGCQKRANINRIFVHATGGSSGRDVAFAKPAADVENIGFDILDVSSFFPKKKPPPNFFWVFLAAIRDPRTLLGPPYSLIRRASLLSSFFTMTNADTNSIAKSGIVSRP